jgi:NADPH-dependent curcumin reductase CurA
MLNLYILINLKEEMVVSRSTKKYILKSRPSGEVSADNFKLIEDTVTDLNPGEILVRTTYLSVDPYMRNRMNNVESYIAPFEVDSAISGDGIAEILETKSDKFAKGDLVVGILPWQEFAVIQESKVRKISPEPGISITAHLGVLGLTGLTAYFGLLDIGKPEDGNTVVVSGAAGAVGSIVGQMAKIYGCKTIGIAGGEKKCDYLKHDLQFDDVIDYKYTSNIRKPLRTLCPERVDIYFDNVGGDISDAVFYMLNNHARVVICGQIALYNLNRLSMGPRMYPQFLIKRVKLQGFIVYDYSENFPEAIDQLKNWIHDGKIQYHENIVEGFENLPEAFLGLFRGENIGKQLVKV